MSGSFDTIQVLKNEIDKGVVFLGREDNEGEPAEPETERRLRQCHLLRPIPRLSAGPNDERGDRDGEQVIWLVKNSAQQRGAGLSVAEPKHAREVGKSSRQIRGAEKDPAEQNNEKRERDPERPRKIMVEPFASLAALESEHAAMESAPDHEIPRRAVPQSAEQHREDQVDVGSPRSFAIAT